MKANENLYDNNFDLLRLLAAIQVLVLHHLAFFTHSTYSYKTIESLIWNFPGVNVFFLISGYLIFQSIERNSLATFAIKRIKRIYPALVVCFILTLVLLISFNSLNSKEIFSLDFLRWIFAQLTIFQFYNPDLVRDFGFGPPNGALWTISIEIQFYILIAGLWYWLLKNKSKRLQNIILVVLFIISATYNCLFHTYLLSDSLAYKLSFNFILSYLYFFITGILVYINKDWCISKVKGRAFWWLISFIAVCFLLAHFQIRYQRYVFNSISFFMLILLTGLVFSIAYTKASISRKILVGNDISYGIYIYQMPIINLFFHLKYNTSFYSLLLSIAICIVMGILSWVLIEKPMLKR